MTNICLKIAQALLFLLCPITFFVSRGAVVFLVVGGVVGLPYFYKNFNIKWFSNNVIQRILLLLVWCFLSSFWSIAPKNSLFLSLRLMVLCFCGVSWVVFVYSLNKEEYQKLIKSLFYGFLLALIILLVDILSGHIWFYLMNKKNIILSIFPFVLTLSMALWPVLLYIKNNVAHVFIIILSGILLALIDCDTAPMAVLFASFSVLFFSFSKRIFLKFLKASCYAAFILPFVFHFFITFENIETISSYMPSLSSYTHRLYIYKSVSAKIMQKPLLGYGLDTSRTKELGGSQKEWAAFNKKGQKYVINSDEIPLHPHNAPLQWWLELGFVGVFLFVILQVQLLRRVLPITYFSEKAKTGLIVSALFIAFVNLGFWQNWWLSVLWILGGVCTRKFDSPSQEITMI
ncbi:MAG: O-antigen ligase family protein [Alphaproteobacteria bacterium]